eukprot:jgi/Mesvir1/5255/Mv15372-RA.2
MQRISTPDLCDMAEEKGIQTHILQPGLLRSYGGIQNFYGVIETCRVPDDNSRVKELLQTPGNGRVLVVDGGGEMRCALLGDLIAESAHKNGWAGVIINGCVRDVDEVSLILLSWRCARTRATSARCQLPSMDEVSLTLAPHSGQMHQGQ